MRTKRNGASFGLLCGVSGCDEVYAEVYPETQVLMVYLRHYRRPHSPQITVDQFKWIGLYTFDVSQGDVAHVDVRCGCGLPFLTIDTNQIALAATHRVRVEGKNIYEVHQNIWGLREVEKVSLMLGLKYDTIPASEPDFERLRKRS